MVGAVHRGDEHLVVVAIGTRRDPDKRHLGAEGAAPFSRPQLRRRVEHDDGQRDAGDSDGYQGNGCHHRKSDRELQGPQISTLAMPAPQYRHEHQHSSGPYRTTCDVDKIGNRGPKTLALGDCVPVEEVGDDNRCRACDRPGGVHGRQPGVIPVMHVRLLCCVGSSVSILGGCRVGRGARSSADADEFPDGDHRVGGVFGRRDVETCAGGQCQPAGDAECNRGAE